MDARQETQRALSPVASMFSFIPSLFVKKAIWAILILVGMSLFDSGVQADAPWPPQPSDLFARGVEVLYTYPAFDDPHRTLYLYRDGDWQSYPYPDELDTTSFEEAGWDRPLFYAFERPDATWLIVQRDPDMLFGGFYNISWTFDPTNGVFRRIIPPCDATEETMSAWVNMEPIFLTERGPVPNPWVYAEENGQTILCSMLTEEKSVPLPGNVVTGSGYGISPFLPDISPDAKMAVFMTYEDRRPPWYTIYSYDLDTQATIRLGTLYPHWSEDVWFGMWIDNTRSLLYVEAMGEWQWRNLYVGDATQPDSLGFAMRKFRFWPRLLAFPPRIENMDSVMEDGFSPRPCSLKIYDLTTRRYAEYTTGNLCDYGILIPDGTGDRLYRAVDPRASVVRYNVVTGQRQTLFTGEVERVRDVSPGGRYAVIGLGNNGLVDIGEDPTFGPGGYPGLSIDDLEAMFVDTHLIMDLSTGAWVAEFPAFGAWFSDEVILVMPPDAPHTLVKIVGGTLIESPLPGQVLQVLTKRDQLLLQNEEGGIDLYTVSTGETTPVVNAVEGLYYHPGVLQDDITHLIVTNTPNWSDLVAEWDIRLP
jgi:hypothetical protein